MLAPCSRTEITWPFLRYQQNREKDEPRVHVVQIGDVVCVLCMCEYYAPGVQGIPPPPWYEASVTVFVHIKMNIVQL